MGGDLIEPMAGRAAVGHQFLTWAVGEFLAGKRDKALSPRAADQGQADLPRQLGIGSFFYAMGFLFTFANVYWLDERAEDRPWSIYRVMINATAMCLLVLLGGDLWAQLFGVPFG